MGGDGINASRQILTRLSVPRPFNNRMGRQLGWLASFSFRPESFNQSAGQ